MYHDIAPYVPFPHFWDWRDTYVFLELQMVGLKAIIVSVDDSNENDNKESIKQMTAAATYANADPSILAIQIPSPSSTLIDAVRTISSTLPYSYQSTRDKSTPCPSLLTLRRIGCRCDNLRGQCGFLRLHGR
jgi:hypothetical protein